MTTFEFIKANPFSALAAAVIIALVLFFPVILIPLFLVGWLYELKSAPAKTCSNPTNTSTHLPPLVTWTTERYHTYLSSPKWKEKVAAVKSRDKVCQLTGDTTNLEVHHIHYDNLGNEYLEDLILLSRRAHQFVHDYYGSYDRSYYYPIEPLKGLIK